MTAEQHTSIAHSDGDTPRVDDEVQKLINAVDEFHTDLSVNADMHSATISHYTAKITRLLARPTPDQIRDDTEQIDDQVQDLYMTGVADGVVDWYGGISPDADVFERMYQRFRKDLASLGIRLTYDTTIGGE